MYINTDEEVWKDVIGYEGLYQVSSRGEVKSFQSAEQKILKQRNHKGYNIINLSKAGRRKTFSVARLVAMAFIPNPDDKPQVNHIDEVKTNNHVNNLEWATPKENSNHGTRNRKVIKNLDWVSENQKTPVAMIDKTTGETIQKFESINEAFRHLNIVVNGSISKACNGNQKTAYGYKWAYTQVEVAK